MTSSGPSPFQRRHAGAITRLYGSGGASRWGLAEADLARALERSAKARFRGEESADARQVEDYLGSLHVEDLILAAACEAGSASAWERFVTEYRPRLLRAARAVAGDESRARELADSLYADLYGLEERDGHRRSLFAYYHGRSSLGGWLRAIVAQRHVDRIRAERRTRSLDEPAPVATPVDPSPRPGDTEPDRARLVKLLVAALTAAIASLDARERLRLSLYHLRSRTLAEIGALFGEHESTVSRKLERSRRRLRKAVDRALRRDGLSSEKIGLCYEYGVMDWPRDLAAMLEDGTETARKGESAVPQSKEAN